MGNASLAENACFWISTCLLAGCISVCNPIKATEPLGAEHRETFGSRQIAQLLEDRPEMVGILLEDSFVIRWIANRFNEGDCGSRVHWDHLEPFSGRASECQIRTRKYPAAVRIASGIKTSPMDKWVALIFEFHNLECFQTVDEDLLALVAKKMDTDTFAVKCVKREFDAIQATKAFLLRDEVNIGFGPNDTLGNGFLSSTSDFKEYMAFIESQPSSLYSPVDYFKRYAESVLAGTAARELKP